MGWDERIFAALSRFVRRRSDARAADARPHAVDVDVDVRARLAVLASAIADRKVLVHPAEQRRAGAGETSEGGTDDGALRLPATFWVAPNAEDNARALLLRVAYGATSLRLGLVFGGASASPGARLLASLLAVPATLEALFLDLPGARPLYDALVPVVLANRAAGSLNAKEGLALEGLVRVRLGVPLGTIAQEVPGDVEAWLRRVAEEHPGDATSLRESLVRTADFPGGGTAEPVSLWGRLLEPEAQRARGAGAAPVPSAGGERVTERRAPPRENVREVVLKDEPENENPMVHSFEKVHTVEAYHGGSKRIDDADELGEQGEALDEAEVREVVRTAGRSRSVYQADLAMATDASGELDLEGTEGIPYDEWDGRSRQFLRDHCRVRIVRDLRRVSQAEAHAATRPVLLRERQQVDKIRALFEQVSASRRLESRQLEGSDIDIDAVVERHVTLRSGHSGSERLYLDRRSHARDLAVLILLDCSLSTDAWVSDARVMDVAKEGLYVLSEAMGDQALGVGLAGFYSHTRHDCRWLPLKSFEEPWELGRRRLVPLEPTGYTRIGPALRHATAVLDAHDARRKLLLLVSDGKPTDYDRYEGQHGLMDVRHAVLEAEQRGITPFAIAVDSRARAHLPQMFGRLGYETMLRPKDLARALGRACATMLR